MVESPAKGKKVLGGFTSTIAWLALFVAFVSTAAIMTVNNLNHVGNMATVIVSEVSKNESAIDSILQEFKKNADSKTVAEIDKNSAKIKSTISSIGGSKEFQDALASTLNRISTAILDGAPSVKVDFTTLANLAADRVNASAKSEIISKKELSKIKPQILDIAKPSKVVMNAKRKVKEITLAWVLWLFLIVVLFLLRGWRTLRTAGGQLLSVGLLFVALRIALPTVIRQLLQDSTLATYQKELVPNVMASLSSQFLTLSITISLIGAAMIVLSFWLGHRDSSNVQTNPSDVA